MKGKNGNEEAGRSSNSSAWDGDTDHCDQTIFTFGTAVTAQVHAYIRDLSQHIHDQYDMTCEGGSVWVLLALCIVFAYACDVCM